MTDSSLESTRSNATRLSRPSRLLAVAAFCAASTPLSRSRLVTFLAMSLKVHGSASGDDCWNSEARLSKLSSLGCRKAQETCGQTMAGRAALATREGPSTEMPRRPHRGDCWAWHRLLEVQHGGLLNTFVVILRLATP